MRYILFGSHEFYYAKGGAHDLLDLSDDLDKIIQKAKNGEYKGDYDQRIVWWHIFDCNKGCIVAGTESQPHGALELSEFENVKVIG